MKDRIRQLMESQHMNQQSFSSFTGIAPATLSQILLGRNRPTLNTVEAICKKMPMVNLSWLINGEGDMMMKPTNDPESAGDTVGGMVSDGVQPGASSDVLSFSFEEEQTPSRAASTPRQSAMGRSSQQRPAPMYHDEKNIDTKKRRITEIRVFYDDQTWESFVPKK